jgi:hypothetical protein
LLDSNSVKFYGESSTQLVEIAAEPIISGPDIYRVPVGGKIDSSVQVTNSRFSFTSGLESTLELPNGNKYPAMGVLSFRQYQLYSTSDRTSSNSYFVAFDESLYRTSAAAGLSTFMAHEDTAGFENTTYFKDILDNLNNGLKEPTKYDANSPQSAHGLIGSHILNGVNTRFLLDLEAGDLIRVSLGSAATSDAEKADYCRIEKVIDDNTLRLTEPLSQTYSTLGENSQAAISVSPGMRNYWIQSGTQYAVDFSFATREIGKIASISNSATPQVTFGLTSEAPFNTTGTEAFPSDSSERIPVQWIGGNVAALEGSIYWLQPLSTPSATVWDVYSYATGNDRPDTSNMDTYSEGTTQAWFRFLLAWPWKKSIGSNSALSPKHIRAESNRVMDIDLPQKTEPTTGRTILQTRIVAGSTDNAVLAGDVSSNISYSETLPNIARYAILGLDGYSSMSDSDEDSYVDGELEGVVELNYYKGAITAVSIEAAGANYFKKRSDSGTATFTARMQPREKYDVYGAQIYSVQQYSSDNLATSTNIQNFYNTDVPTFDCVFSKTSGALISATVVNGGTGHVVGETFKDFQEYMPANSSNIGYKRDTVTVAELKVSAIDGMYQGVQSINILEPLRDKNGIINLQAAETYAIVGLDANNNRVKAFEPIRIMGSSTSATLAIPKKQLNIYTDCILAQIDTTEGVSGENIQVYVEGQAPGTSGEGIIQYDTVTVGKSYVLDTSFERGVLAEIEMENTTGIEGTAYASCAISGRNRNIGRVESQVLSINGITSGKVPVFTSAVDIDEASSGFHYQNVLEINGIPDDLPMSALNGRRAYIIPGSASLITGTSKIAKLVPSSTTGATVTGNTSGLALTPRFDPLFDSAATITASCSATTLTIVSIDTPGSNYGTGLHEVTLGGKTWSVNIQGGANGVILNTHEHPAERRKFRIKTSYRPRNFPALHIPIFSHVINSEDSIDTSSLTALGSGTGANITQINPVTFELVISGTFDSEQSTIPSSYITAVGSLDLGDFYGNNRYMDISGGSLSSESLISTYSLHELAEIRQTDGNSKRVFMGTIQSVVTLSATKVRLIFKQADTSGSEPAINGFGTESGAFSNAGTTSTLVGSGSAGLLTFTNVTPTAAPFGGAATMGTWDFKIRDDGLVYDIVPNNQGSYLEGTLLIFAQGDLASANAGYVSTRGQFSVFVDVHGAPSASLDGSLLFSGTTEQVVASADQVLEENFISLSGSVPTKSTANYTARLQAKLERGAGFEIVEHTGLGTSSHVGFSAFNIVGDEDDDFTIVQADHGIGERARVKYISTSNGRSDSYSYYASNEPNNSDYVVYLYKDVEASATPQTGSVFTDYDDASDAGIYPHQEGYSRGMYGYVHEQRGYTAIERIQIDGEIKP